MVTLDDDDAIASLEVGGELTQRCAKGALPPRRQLDNWSQIELEPTIGLVVNDERIIQRRQLVTIFHRGVDREHDEEFGRVRIDCGYW